MVICSPVRNWKGINYRPLEDYKTDNFVVQTNSWLGWYRILVISTKYTYLIAYSSSRTVLEYFTHILTPFRKFFQIGLS